MITPKDLRLQISYKQILTLTLPISLAMLAPQINFITNNVFLGHYGKMELACAGITGVYYLIFTAIGMGLNNGIQLLMARRAGQNAPEQIGKLFFNGVCIALTIATLGIMVTKIFVPSIFYATIHNSTMAEMAINYLMIRIWGLPIILTFGVLNAFLIGINHTRFLFWGTVSGAIVNIFFDYSLIYGHFGMPALGFNGVAYSSLFAETIGLLVILLVIVVNKLHLQFQFRESIVIRWTSLKLILTQSFPLIVQYAISIISWQFFFILIEHHGERDLAISNAMRNIFGIIGMFSWSFAATSNTMVSNIIGQGRKEEVLLLVKRIAKISVGFTLVLVCLLNIFPRFILSFYGQGEDFISNAIPVVWVISIALIIMSFSVVWLNAVAGSGSTHINLVIELISITIYVAYVYFVLEVWNKSIVYGWMSEGLYWSTMFILAFLYMRFGNWRKRNI